AEAEMLAIIGAPDVLLAYQPVGPRRFRLIQLIKKFPATKFSCLIDNEVTATELASAAKEQGVVVNVFLDLNVGMNRTGIAPEKALPC
ncbi:MAG: alanine racemase, partial [Cyclobacteriaceae bacterium]